VTRSVDKALNTDVYLGWLQRMSYLIQLFWRFHFKKVFQKILPFPLQKFGLWEKEFLKISAFLKVIYNWCRSC
jgi:hypothetical protein